MAKELAYATGGFDLHEPNTWLPGVILDIEEVPSKNPDWKDQYKFIVQLDDDEPLDNGEDRHIWAYCSQSLWPTSKYSGWVRDLGFILAKGELFNYENLIGMAVEVRFEHEGAVDKATGSPTTKEHIADFRKSEATPKLKKMQKEAAEAKAAGYDSPDERPF